MRLVLPQPTASVVAASRDKARTSLRCSILFLLQVESDPPLFSSWAEDESRGRTVLGEVILSTKNPGSIKIIPHRPINPPEWAHFVGEGPVPSPNACAHRAGPPEEPFRKSGGPPPGENDLPFLWGFSLFLVPPSVLI